MPDEVTQEELDNISRNSIMVRKAEVMDSIEKNFLDAITKLKSRSTYDQTIMGNFITVLEGEVLTDLKKLKTHK